MSETAVVGAVDGDRALARDGGGSTAAVVAVVAGLVGAAIGCVQLVVPPSVPSSEFGHPFDHVTGTVVQVVLFLHHVAVALVVPVVVRLAAPGRHGRIAGVLAVVGLVLLGLQELVAVAALPQRSDSSFADLVDTGFAAWSVLLGAAFIALGVAVIRARRWHGWTRGLPLVIGGYMFVPMIPALVGPQPLPVLALAVWSLLFTALGVAVLQTRRSARLL